MSIRPSERALSDFRSMLSDEENPLLDEAALRYVASGEGLTLTLNRSLLERAVDRRLERRARKGEAATAAAPGAAPAAPPESAWLGQHLAVRLRGEALDVLSDVISLGDGQEELRSGAFRNLPVLNEWHRRFPGEDPIAVHERLWNRRLLCPGGGAYRWNAEWQTMESSVYGHPGAPLDGPRLPPALTTLDRAAAGLTFEEDGVRARFEVLTK